MRVIRRHRAAEFVPLGTVHHGFQAGAGHAATADRVINVNLGERPAMRRGEFLQFGSLLIQ